MPDHRVYAISAGRPGNVAAMRDIVTDPLTWVVPADQADTYRAAGADVLPVPHAGPRPLAAQRNAALDDAHHAGAVCVQTDDDLTRLAQLDTTGRAAPTTWARTVARLLAALDGQARHAGCPPTDNPYFTRPGVRPGFIIGCLTATAPCPQRYDPELPLKEDYDYTCRHLHAHGTVARVGELLPTYRHYDNPGGCATYRDPATERAAVRVLLERWPAYLRTHPRRRNEVVLHPRARSAGRRRARSA